jgi:hypothetical protein
VSAGVAPAHGARNERHGRIGAVGRARQHALASRRVVFDASSGEREDVAERWRDRQFAEARARKQPLGLAARRSRAAARGRAFADRRRSSADPFRLAERKISRQKSRQRLEGVRAEHGRVGRDSRVRREARRNHGRRKPRLDQSAQRVHLGELRLARKRDRDRRIAVGNRMQAKKEILGRLERELAGGERRVGGKLVDERATQALDLALGGDRLRNRPRLSAEPHRLGRERRARPHPLRAILARPRPELRAVGRHLGGANGAERLVVSGRGGTQRRHAGQVRVGVHRGKEGRRRCGDRRAGHAREGGVAAHHRGPPNATER